MRAPASQEHNNLDKAMGFRSAALCVKCTTYEYLGPTNVCNVFQERDNLDKAMECYSAALSVKPNFPQSLNNMGVIFTAQVVSQGVKCCAGCASARRPCKIYFPSSTEASCVQTAVPAV